MRGEGTTTKQMKEAPKGAFFVITGEHPRYWMDLAKHLERTDLRITSVSFVENNSRGHRHLIVVDHAASLPKSVDAYVAEHNMRVKEPA